MGREKTAKGKTVLKEKCLDSHIYINKYGKIVKSSHYQIEKREGKIIDYLQSEFAGREVYAYFDFSIHMTRQVDGLKHQTKKKGSTLLKRLTNNVMSYNLLDPNSVVLGNDGNPKKRPKIKEKRKVKERTFIQASELKITNSFTNLDSKGWRDNRSNNDFNNKVWEFIINGVTERWKYGNNFTTLIIDSAIIKGENGKFGYSAVEVTNKKTFEIDSVGCAEGEQFIYAHLSRNCEEISNALHVIDGGNDTDHYTYCMLFQNKFKDARLLLRLIHYKTIIGGEEVFQTTKRDGTYMIDIHKMNNQLIDYANSRLNGRQAKFDIIMVFALCWGILIGNDFTWSYEKGDDPYDPKKYIYLYSRKVLMGVNSIILFNNFIKKNEKIITLEDIDGVPTLTLNRAVIMDVFEDCYAEIQKRNALRRFIKKHMNVDDLNSLEFDELQKIYDKKLKDLIKMKPINPKKLDSDKKYHMDEIINRGQWNLNYFINPGDDRYLKYEKRKKRSRVEKVKKKKRRKLIKK